MICTRLCPGHLSVRVGDSSGRCEEIVKNRKWHLWIQLLLLMFRFSCTSVFMLIQLAYRTSYVLDIYNFHTVWYIQFSHYLIYSWPTRFSQILPSQDQVRLPFIAWVEDLEVTRRPGSEVLKVKICHCFKQAKNTQSSMIFSNFPWCLFVITTNINLIFR